MYKTDVRSVPTQDVETQGASKVRIQWLITEDVAPTFAMRRFTIEPGGHTPFHRHDWEHEVFVLSGKGRLFVGTEREEISLGEEDVIFIPPMEWHQFAGVGDVEFAFLCLIPIEKKGNAEVMAK